MDTDRGISLLADPDQWARCSHDRTALVPGGGVQLSWFDSPSGEDGPLSPGGLAFDRWCRAYRSRPLDGRVDVLREGQGSGGDEPCPGPFREPRALAVDRAQRLYVAEPHAGTVAVIDLWSRRFLRRVPVRQRGQLSRRPVDLAADCCRVLVLLANPAGLVVIQGRRGPLPGPQLRRPRCHTNLEATRLIVTDEGDVLVLWQDPQGRQSIVATVDGTDSLDIPDATDIGTATGGLLIVARQPDQPFLRFRTSGGNRVELEPIAADGYDGGAVQIAPDGAVAFTTEDGFACVGGSAARHRTSGTVTTYRLDSGTYRAGWGRVFIDACLPANTDVRLRFVSGDEDDVPDPVEWLPAERASGSIRRPDLTPPMVSESALAAAGDGRPLYRRSTGREHGWTQIAADDGFETYEVPVFAARGRYLWIALDLTGTAVATPTIRALRVERPGHRLLDHLPKAWSRDDQSAAFLQRYLAPTEGLLHELDEKSALRHLLVDPAATPQEALGWLASFAGLVLDRRWPEPARRTLIAEAYALFKRRGTRHSLTRLLEIYLGYPPVIVEQWQLRGIPGGYLGARPGEVSPAALGSGMRTGGGVVGDLVLGGRIPGDNGYDAAAHRFSVLIPADLTSEQLQVVTHVLDIHRPAHTTYELCELGFGMRVGRRLHVSLTSVVGPGAGWGPALVGQMAVGGDGIVGVPVVGSRLGVDSETDGMRVG
ncbi:phage tail P2-like protein [Kribbella orskensis]|uniref:Phage tail P2-like protein n=1 Tax=Kribbella orskensis TaxID=2512216 RepID=A0ABY2B9Z6_9ACTN|nr:MULTISPECIES: phage tail protein [Kribbella]TCN32788.1 phage tail P2-like protein [Kribbella sp. VKM Ac-2500]TCO12894.1 phage tail P2-like protein [Kribbella orskensis]